jgi:hypothetical protein
MAAVDKRVNRTEAGLAALSLHDVNDGKPFTANELNPRGTREWALVTAFESGLSRKSFVSRVSFPQLICFQCAGPQKGEGTD